MFSIETLVRDRYEQNLEKESFKLIIEA